MPSAPPARSPAAWRGPLRAGVAIFVVGFLVVWLIKPLGNPCPDLGSLPAGSTASSSPSFAPPGSRTCTYTAVGGTKATAKYMPWLDWIVLLLLAAVGAGAVRALSPVGRDARPEAERAARPPRGERSPGTARAPRADRAPEPERLAVQRRPRAGRPPRASAAADPSPGASTERDAAAREQARRERAERDRNRRAR